MTNSLVSIIVPVYNVENEIERCIKSIQNQTYRQLEIILVDDGSTDESGAICERFSISDSRIKLIKKNNGGLSDARNTGLKNAKGEYILYVDSDDYIELDACEKLIKNMTSEIDFIVGVIKELNNGKTTYQKRTSLKSGNIYDSKEFIIESIKTNEFYSPAVLNMYKKNFLLDNQLFFKKGIYFEDQEILLRLFLSADKICYLEFPFYNYIIREGSITTSKTTDKKIKDVLLIWKEWLSTIKAIPDKELQNYLFGIVIKNYLCNCRQLGILGWKIPEMNFKFAFKYALTYKEKVKVMFFSILPRTYIRIGRRKNI